MSSEDVPPVTVWVRFPVRVPEGTDPEKVVAVANHHLDDDDGLLCQWGRWLPGDAELVGP
jgi:hypothetical protein